MNKKNIVFQKILRYIKDEIIKHIDDYQIFGIKTFGIKLFNQLRFFRYVYSKAGAAYRKLLRIYVRKIGFCPYFFSYLLPKPNGVRRYISPHLGITQTFELLNQRDVKYVILRWFEDLPEWPDGEDIDILIDDNDLPKVKDLFVWFSSCEPVDIYTVSALNGWNDLPYYPISKSRRMLEQRELFLDKFYVPSLEHVFYSLAYHAVLHKGYSSGISFDGAGPEKISDPDHAYKQILTKYRPKKLNIDITLDSLWESLNDAGWLPELDTLSKLSLHNEWINSKVAFLDSNPHEGELMVFVIRGNAHEIGFYNHILNRFEKKSLELTPILIHELSSKELSKAKKYIRGGEWGKGCFDVSGGEPVSFVIVFDYVPEIPNEKEKKLNPHLTNQHYYIKHEIRNFINRNILFTKSCNVIHSPDNEFQAIEYIEKCLDPLVIKTVLNKLNMHRERCASDSIEVVKRFPSYAKRAKVELVKYQNGLAVKKTFKLSQERFFERELYAYQQLSSKTKLLPKLLEVGQGYIIIEHIVRTHKEINLASYKEEIINFLYLLYENNLFYTDFHQKNIIVSKGLELKVLDFEFLQSYADKPKSFNASYDIAGLPEHVIADRPYKYCPKKMRYSTVWKPILGPLPTSFKKTR